MFKKLLTLKEAKQRIEKSLSPKPLGIEKIPLKKASGRALAEDIISPLNVPPFHRSTVDGYAVIAEDTFRAQEDQPVTLNLTGRVEAGAISTSELRKGNVLEIVTGAPLPTGSNAVVMIENTTQKDETILVFKPVAKGENIMEKGSDIHKDEIVLKKGDILSHREVGVVAALGLPHIKVFRKPRVGIISTGAEIVEIGKPLSPGKIYDINSYTLGAAVTEAGCMPISFGIARDHDINSLKSVLKKAIEEVDMVITSGGVSVGPKDIVPSILNTLGKPGLLVHGVAVKPGKPVAYAIVENKPVFSLPGNPTSALLIFHLIVRTVLLKLGGRSESLPKVLKAIINQRFFSARGRQTFIPVTLTETDTGQLIALPAATGQSGSITTLAKADGYVELNANTQFLEAGTEVGVFLF
jgi:putative molybdopterin biosynthesis protein